MPIGNYVDFRRADVRLPVALLASSALLLGIVAIGGLDEAVLLAFRASPADPLGPRWLEGVVVNFSAFGSEAITMTTTLAAIGFLLLDRRPRLALFVIVAMAGAVVLTLVLKEAIGRARPDVVVPLTTAGTKAFPSGHAILSAVLYPTLGEIVARAMPRPRVRAYVVSIAFALAIAIGLTRVYIGVHYPTDVLAGWAIGAGWALVCTYAARAMQRRGVVEAPISPPGERGPSLTG